MGDYSCALLSAQEVAVQDGLKPRTPHRSRGISNPEHPQKRSGVGKDLKIIVYDLLELSKPGEGINSMVVVVQDRFQILEGS